MRTTIMIDNLGRAVGRMESRRVADGLMEWRTKPNGELSHGHVRAACEREARAARENERAVGEQLRLIYP